MFEKLPIFFRYVISLRVLEISMSAEGVEIIRLIGHNFRVLHIRWLPWVSKIEQNKKNIHISSFDHSSYLSLRFEGLVEKLTVSNTQLVENDEKSSRLRKKEKINA